MENTENLQKMNLEKIDFSGIIDDMWNGMLRFWYVAILLIALCAGGFILHARLSYTPVYTSSCTFVVNARSTGRYNQTTYNQRVAQLLGEVFPYLLTSDAMNKIIATEMDVATVPGTVTAQAMENTNLITLTVKSRHAQDAYDILQAVITNYHQVSDYIIGDLELELLDDTGVPAAPSNPLDLVRPGLTGAGLGVVLCLVLLLLYAVNRHTIRSENDLSENLNTTCLGTVGYVTFKKRSDQTKKRIVLDNSVISSGFVESYRTIRTRVTRAMKEHGMRSFLVTSALAGEGKTTVSVNLALSMAQEGFRVLLVDGDLRNPSVLNALDMTAEQELGFIDALQGEAQVEDLLIPYETMPNLMVLPSIHQISQTASVLTHHRLQRVMEQMLALADVVIVDTPPAMVVSDSVSYAQCVDGAVYVVRQDYARIDQVKLGIERLGDTRVRLMGCVLNATVDGISSYGYYYGKYGYGRYGRYGRYGYGRYGYGQYGYGEKEAMEAQAAQAEADYQE